MPFSPIIVIIIYLVDNKSLNKDTVLCYFYKVIWLQEIILRFFINLCVSSYYFGKTCVERITSICFSNPSTSLLRFKRARLVQYLYKGWISSEINCIAQYNIRYLLASIFSKKCCVLNQLKIHMLSFKRLSI